jgi:hypothetical protein
VQDRIELHSVTDHDLIFKTTGIDLKVGTSRATMKVSEAAESKRQRLHRVEDETDDKAQLLDASWVL